MELTPEQQNAIARLYENESLTENLDDQSARALLEWAQGQIVANTDDALVRAAVSAANTSGEQEVQALVTTASTFLAQEISARDAATAHADEPPAPMGNDEAAAPAAAVRFNESTAPMTMGDVSTTGPAKAVPDKVTGRAATDNSTQLESGAGTEQNTHSATSSANIGAANPSAPPLAKARRKKSRKSKSPKKK